MTIRRVVVWAVFLSVGPAVRPSLAQCPDGSQPPCRSASAAAAAAPNSVVVLYFDNLSPDTADAYLADGLTEALLLRLGQRLVIKRVSRAVAQRVRDSVPHYATAIGQLLQVRYVVEGSVRRAGPRLRVSTRLVRTRDGVQIWADEFDHATRDILSLEDELARRVVIGIAGRLAPTDRAALVAAPTHSSDAYVHFLQGNFYLAQRSTPALTRAIEEYSAAVRIDPGFTHALGRLGQVYGLFLALGYAYQGLAAESLLARGLTVTDRALRQDTACRLTRGLGGDPSFAAGAGAERPPLRGSPVTTLVLRLPSNGRSLSTQRTRRPITSTAASCGGSVGTPGAWVLGVRGPRLHGSASLV